MKSIKRKELAPDSKGIRVIVTKRPLDLVF
jgi:hypothetical protein